MPAYRKLRGFLLSAQRRRDAKKKLLAAWRLGVSPFFLFSQSRKGAKKLEKPFAAWRLCESNFFFLTKTKNQPAIGRLGVN